MIFMPFETQYSRYATGPPGITFWKLLGLGFCLLPWCRRVEYLSTRLLESKIWLECFQESGKLVGKTRHVMIKCACLTCLRKLSATVI